MARLRPPNPNSDEEYKRRKQAEAKKKAPPKERKPIIPADKLPETSDQIERQLYLVFRSIQKEYRHNYDAFIRKLRTDKAFYTKIMRVLQSDDTFSGLYKSKIRKIESNGTIANLHLASRTYWDTARSLRRMAMKIAQRCSRMDSLVRSESSSAILRAIKAGVSGFTKKAIQDGHNKARTELIKMAKYRRSKNNLSYPDLDLRPPSGYVQRIIYKWAMQQAWKQGGAADQLIRSLQKIAVENTNYVRSIIPSRGAGGIGSKIKSAYITNYSYDYGQMREMEAFQSSGVEHLSSNARASAESQAIANGLTDEGKGGGQQKSIARQSNRLWLTLSFGDITKLDAAGYVHAYEPNEAHPNRKRKSWPLWMILEFGTFRKADYSDYTFSTGRYGRISKSGMFSPIPGTENGYTFGKKSFKGKNSLSFGTLFDEGRRMYYPRVRREMKSRIAHRKQTLEYHPIKIYMKTQSKMRRVVRFGKSRYTSYNFRTRDNTVRTNQFRWIMIPITRKVRFRPRDPNSITGLGPWQTKTITAKTSYQGVAGVHFISKGVAKGRADLQTKVQNIMDAEYKHLSSRISKVIQEYQKGNMQPLKAMEAEIISQRAVSNIQSHHGKR